MICFDIHEFPLIYKKYYCGVLSTPLKINSGVLSQHPIFSGVLPSGFCPGGFCPPFVCVFVCVVDNSKSNVCKDEVLKQDNSTAR